MKGVKAKTADNDVLMHSVQVSSKGIYVRYIKRCLDLISSIIAAVILLPFHLVIFILIKITMPGSVIFKQERVGYRGESFHILKFRTMITDTEAIKEYDSSKDKERVTNLGKLLRRTKLDETLQVYNILKGDMSIVGPRPTVLRAMTEHNINSRRLEVRPGLTGLAQINGNTSLTWQDRARYDIEYIDTLSFWLDFKILIKTIFVVILGENKFLRIPGSEYKINR